MFHTIYHTILIPIRISDFRCSSSIMLAVTDNDEALYWGRCSDGSVINWPKPVEGYEFPRQIFARDRRSDSGGVVYPCKADHFLHLNIMRGRAISIQSRDNATKSSYVWRLFAITIDNYIFIVTTYGGMAPWPTLRRDQFHIVFVEWKLWGFS